MKDDEKVLPRSLLITAVVAEIILGQHVVVSNRVEDENTLQTMIDQLLQELKQEGSLMSDPSVEVELEKKEKKDALKRLSVIMSSRLRDLSDHNRSMEIGEQFSEIYDNEWTDAFEVVKKDYEENEPKIIAFLLSILEQCFKVCQDKARKQLERLQKDVTYLEALITKKRTKLPNDLMQRIKEERKYSAADVAPGYANILPQLKKFLPSNVRDKTGFLEQSALKDFIKECLRVSWLMVIQDPPMAMERKPRAVANETFNVYKHEGNHVAFVVWPALHLEKDGPLISKGVADFRK